MGVERAGGSTSHIDVLDRVLDKGIVIDACFRVALVGMDVLTVARPRRCSWSPPSRRISSTARPLPTNRRGLAPTGK